VVGALLIFSLLISPAAAARSFTNKPLTAMGLSVLIALGTVWAAIALSFLSNLPIGFFVGSIGAGTYAAGRGWVAWRRTRQSAPHLRAPGRSPAPAQSA
jgi:zinc/manganese transport system permease protein